MQQKRWISTALLSGTVATAWLSPAEACGYHGTIGNYFSVMHPSSLVVAAALSRASNDGIIDAEESRIGIRRTALYSDAVHQLHKLKAALSESVSPGNRPPSFALGFVESGLWTRYSIAGERVQMEIHSSGPAEADAVVLTAESVLEGMLAGRLSSEDAFSRELIVIDAPSTDVQALRTSLARAFHHAGDAPREAKGRQTSNSQQSAEGVRSHSDKEAPGAVQRRRFVNPA